MAKQDAVRQVIELKKEYDTLNKQDPKNFYATDKAKQISATAEQIRRANNIDANMYGSGATLAQAYSNYYKEFGTGNSTKQVAPVQETKLPEVPRQEFNPTPYTPTKYDKQLEALINSLPANMLSYDEAKGRANEQLGASYDKALADTLKNIDRQALQTGFFGQLPTVDYKQRNADDIERSRASAIAQLANQLVDSSKADVQTKINALTNYSKNMSDAEFRNWQKQLQERQYSDGRSDVDWEKAYKERGHEDSRNDVDWEKLFKERQYNDSRSDADWNKGITEAQLTGVFKGQPTMAFTQLAHNIGMDNKKMEMAETELNHSIQMAWEKLSLDKTQVAQAWSRIGLQRQGQALDEKKFMSGIKEKAFDMTMKELERTGKVTQDDELGWLMGETNTGTPKVTEKEVLTMLDSYVQVLLGLAVYDEEAPASGTTKYTGWLQD